MLTYSIYIWDILNSELILDILMFLEWTFLITASWVLFFTILLQLKCLQQCIELLPYPYFVTCLKRVWFVEKKMFVSLEVILKQKGHIEHVSNQLELSPYGKRLRIFFTNFFTKFFMIFLLCINRYVQE